MVFINDNPIYGLDPVNPALPDYIGDISDKIVEAISPPRKNLFKQPLIPWVEIRSTNMTQAEDLNHAVIRYALRFRWEILEKFAPVDLNDDDIDVLERTQHAVSYDGSYRAIDYPNGDVPDSIGVCTDLLIRAYRSLGIDLQRLVHEDMTEHFDQYPSRRIWGLTQPDKNIDHRRVPNLQRFFSRQGESLPITHSGINYEPGDIVTWILPGNLLHIGIVSDRINQQTGSPMIIHNIGAGTRLEDMLLHYPITGHYRFASQNQPREM